MKKQEIKYSFVNPNTPDITLKVLQKIVAEKILHSKSDQKVMAM